jgi:hypothetical protein
MIFTCHLLNRYDRVAPADVYLSLLESGCVDRCQQCNKSGGLNVEHADLYELCLEFVCRLVKIEIVAYETNDIDGKDTITQHTTFWKIPGDRYKYFESKVAKQRGEIAAYPGATNIWYYKRFTRSVLYVQPDWPCNQHKEIQELNEEQIQKRQAAVLKIEVQRAKWREQKRRQKDIRIVKKAIEKWNLKQDAIWDDKKAIKQ